MKKSRVHVRLRKGKGIGSFLRGLVSRGAKLVNTGAKIFRRGKDFYEKNKGTFETVANTAANAYNTLEPHIQRIAREGSQVIKDSAEDARQGFQGSGLRGNGMRSAGMRSGGMRANGYRRKLKRGRGMRAGR